MAEKKEAVQPKEAVPAVRRTYQHIRCGAKVTTSLPVDSSKSLFCGTCRKDFPTGPQGEFFWDGAAGTWFWVDPTNDIVFIGMIQRLLGPSSPNLEYESRATVYGALVDLSK